MTKRDHLAAIRDGRALILQIRRDQFAGIVSLARDSYESANDCREARVAVELAAIDLAEAEIALLSEAES